ncbi:hypothetical protein [Agromyces albus]|uniref:hypothetical protein n=1 Tax=Agromyces albus TaxID=205332 RepID=UPI00277D5412|nr:hypothetical protein [Agromyces albus]MDQ0574868.1 nitrogen fixation protein FixH [Agromyces albus]
MSTPRAASAPAAPGDLGARPRPGSRFFRRFAAALTTIVLGTGLAVAGVAAPASAHHNTITADAVCATDGKTADITWSVTNSENRTETITASSLEKVVPEGTKISEKATSTFVQKNAKVGIAQTLTLWAEWSNGQTKNDSFSYTPSSDLCGGGGGGDKVCDPLDTGHLKADNAVSYPITAPEGKLIAEVCVKAGSTKQGNGPEYTTLPTPSATTTIAHSSGKQISHYSVRYVNAPKVIEVVGAPSYSDTCGPDNEKVELPAETDTVDWEQVEADGKWVVTATAKSGYVFPDEAKTSWEFPIDDVPCVILVEGAPSFTDTCGPDNEKVELPADTDTIAWTKAEVDGTWIVTATAQDGSVFPEGASVSWSFTINDAPCLIELVGTPTFEDSCGPDNEKLDLPADTDTIAWTKAEVDGTWIVTATADSGFTFPEGTTIEWEYLLDDQECAEPSLAGSTMTGVCRADAPWIVFDIVLADPDGQASSGDASLVFSDGEHIETIGLGELDESGALEGEVLWPGASVADDGVTPIGWPGWEQVDGEWVETEGNFAWTRDVTSVLLVVNPDLEVAITYPVATPDCVAAPPRDVVASGAVSAPSGTGLASTGFAGTTIAIVAGVIVMAGIALLVITRVRRARR